MPTLVHGQALIELLVALPVLLTAFVLIALFGKYQSIHWATLGAARELAFDCTVRDAACRQADGGELGRVELSRRMFAAADRPIRADGDGAGSRAPSTVALWVDARGRALHSPAQRLQASIARESLDAGVAVARSYRDSDMPVNAQAALDQGGPARFGWQMNEGLLIARTASQIGDSAAGDAGVAGHGGGAIRGSWRVPVDPLSLRFRGTVAIVANAWNASGPDLDDGDSVLARVERGRRLDAPIETRLLQAYAPVRAYAALVRSVGLERTAPPLAPAEPDPDRVPDDRLRVAR